jgi:hypothetical protein
MRATGNYFNFKHINNEDRVYIATELISDDNEVCYLVSWEAIREGEFIDRVNTVNYSKESVEDSLKYEMWIKL